MDSNEVKLCARCGCQIPDDESYTLAGQTVCEECYLCTSYRVQTCDPLAVRSAQAARKAFGVSASEGLTARQRSIRDYIASSGRTTAAELENALAISPGDLENDLAVLRHCEMVKGRKEGGTVYLVLY